MTKDAAHDARVGEERDEPAGWGTGEEPIARVLQMPRARVRRALAPLKAERRARMRKRARSTRRSTVVQARDVLWSMDATHLGRDARGHAVQAEVVREVASTRRLDSPTQSVAFPNEWECCLGVKFPGRTPIS